MAKIASSPMGTLGGLGALLILLPLLISNYWVGILTQILIFGIFAASLNLIMGYMNVASFGHAAGFGSGAYAIAILTVKAGFNPLVAVLGGLLVSAGIFGIFGLLVLRAKGVYLVMLTLALSQVLWAIAWKWHTLTGGGDGLSGVRRPNLGLKFWQLSEALGFYYFVLLVFAVAMGAMYLVVNSPFGLSAVGIRESESRMTTLGYNTWLHKYCTWILSGGFAGFAGVLFAWYTGFVCPDELSPGISLECLLMVTLGGSGTFFGPLLGAATIILLKHVVSFFTTHWQIVIGAIYVVAILCLKNGIIGILRRET